MTPFTESEFTIFVVALTAAHSVSAVILRFFKRDMFTLALAFPAFVTMLIPEFNAYYIILWAGSFLMMIYNIWYVNATDDELAEGLIWPRFRDRLMKEMDVISEEDAEAAVDHSTHADRRDV